jgi:sulfide:quinone oxidoreductase
MAKVAIIGAGFAGQTAALYLGDALGAEHEITVINRLKTFSYVPSWVWVGIGRMPVEKTMFPLEPVYDRFGVRFVHGRATEVRVDERAVVVERDGGAGTTTVGYDHLIIATGPRLDFDGTEGLGPEGGFSQSICTGPHAEQARDRYLEQVARMEKGERRRFVIGTGHPGATCQGAAFEYITNVHKDLVRRGVRDKADLLWLSNEQALGDFGVRGVSVRRKGSVLSSEEFIAAVFKEYGIGSRVRTGVLGLTEDTIAWEDFEGRKGETGFDFSMLIPRFLGQPLAFVDKDGADVSADILAPNGLVKVDAKYGLPYDELSRQPDAWPSVYQNPAHPEIFAAGIAFAPPGPISVPHTTPNGTAIAAAPPRTGMVSGIIGRVVALNVIDLIQTGAMTHGERMTEMYAACIASMGDSLWDGSAAVIMIYPVVPDTQKYPNGQGRDLFVTHMEMGLAGAWMKRMIQTTFMHKLRGRPGWQFIPE